MPSGVEALVFFFGIHKGYHFSPLCWHFIIELGLVFFNAVSKNPPKQNEKGSCSLKELFKLTVIRI